MFNSNKKIVNLDENFITILSYFRNYHVEYGGIVFGLVGNNSIDIKTFSSKKGNVLSITFTDEDYQLFYPPRPFVICGTWHLHPNKIGPQASSTDLNQWKKWPQHLYHLILSQTDLWVYYKGKVIKKIAIQ